MKLIEFLRKFNLTASVVHFMDKTMVLNLKAIPTFQICVLGNETKQKKDRIFCKKKRIVVDAKYYIESSVEFINLLINSTELFNCENRNILLYFKS